MRRVCEALGVDNARQQSKLKQKPWAVVGFMSTTAADGKNYDTFCIDLDSLPMWLATIEPARVAEAVRPKLIAFQQEAARALRDYFFGGAAINPRLQASLDRLQLARAKEARMSRQLEARNRREEAKNRREEAAAIDKLVRVMLKYGYSDDQIRTYEIVAVETATGKDLSDLKPELAKWYSPTQLAAEFDDITAHKVGRIVTRLGIRGDKRYSKRIVNKAKHSNREVETYLYNEGGAELIRAEIRKHIGSQLLLV